MCQYHSQGYHMLWKTVSPTSVNAWLHCLRIQISVLSHQISNHMSNSTFYDNPFKAGVIISYNKRKNH